jgi:ATP-dependent RNA/DNA helicase IGHMBP2
MNELHPHQQKIIDLISLEMKEQEHRYKLDGQASLKQLKAEGLVLHPITVTRKSFGYADYPEITFKLPYSNETNNFKDSVAIECFIEGEESIKGILIGMDGKKGEFRLFAPDFPDWIEDKGVGIKIAPDHRTSENMIGAIKNLSQHPFVFELFKKIHGNYSFTQDLSSTQQIREFRNKSLNSSQQKAVSGMVQNEQLIVLHGPPGTGKTTTLIEGIVQLILQGKRILVSAPSNAAVDTIAKGLLKNQAKILRVGNTLKVDQEIFPFTPEGKMQDAKEQKEIKKLKIRAEELRRMSYQYKRNFGKDEREQRALLQKEVKSIRKEIRALRDYFDEKLYEQAEVVVGTPIGLSDFLPKNALFDTLVLDEAGQSIEALAWIIFPFAKSWVLAGDPFQLPPTVLSNDAGRNGLSISILEHSFRNCQDVFFLDTQYRMRKSIADFSSNYFYQAKLITPENQLDISQHITFYDTAGTGFEEQTGQNGTSLMNEGELDIIQKLIECEGLDIKKCAVISPYSGQVQLAKDLLSSDTLVSTIDSFQGQENEIIILSLVRSNSDAVIGFLKDYRRMNVALTRAKEQLFVIGDSATIGQDEFYANFLAYVEEVNGYRSAWELLG